MIRSKTKAGPESAQKSHPVNKDERPKAEIIRAGFAIRCRVQSRASWKALPLRVDDPVCPVSTKCVYRSSSSNDFSAMQHPAGNEVLFPSFQWNPLSVNDQCVTALYYKHVFVIIVGMRR
jgi:hypothetical protein